MTVSQRASEIYRLTKPSGGTWSEAMSQAYEDIARTEMEAEERNAREEISNLVANIRDANTGAFYDGRSLNNLIGDMINAVVDLNYDNGLKYPYTSAKQKLESVGLNEIESLVYSYTKKDTWDASYRIKGGNPDGGRISSAWLTDALNIMSKLNITPEMLDGYDEVMNFFVG